MELLEGAKSTAQVVTVQGVHPNTVNNLKQHLLDSRPEIYAKDETEYERQIANQFVAM